MGYVVPISWNPVPSPDYLGYAVTGYKVYAGQQSGIYNDQNSPQFVSGVNTTAFNYPVDGIHTYYLVVSAIDSQGLEGGWSQELQKDAIFQADTAEIGHIPSACLAMILSALLCLFLLFAPQAWADGWPWTLTWTDTNSGTARTLIEIRLMPNGTYSQLGSVLPGVNTFVDNSGYGCLQGQVCRYRIRANSYPDGSYVSTYSNEACAPPPCVPAVPTGVQ